MILWLRSLVFNALFYVGTAVIMVLWLPSLILPQAVLHVGFRVWARYTQASLWLCLNITHRFEGRRPAPGEAVIVAGKHQSAWETLALALPLDRPAFVLKRELKRIPILGWYIAKMQMIPVDRDGGGVAVRAMLKAAKAAKADGRPIVIFPEGTRVDPDDNSHHHQAGVAALYKALKLPIIPFALNSGLKWGREAFVKTPGVITVDFLDPIPVGMAKQDLLPLLKDRVDERTRALVAQERARSEPPT